MIDIKKIFFLIVSLFLVICLTAQYVYSQAKPDLTITSIEIIPSPGPYYENDEITIKIHIKNIGSANIVNSRFQLKYSINGVQQQSPTGWYNLNAGQSTYKTYYKTFSEHGQYIISGEIDYLDEIDESNEGNNFKNKIINILEPQDTNPPPIPSLVSPANSTDFSTNDTITLDWDPVADPEGNGVKYECEVSTASNFTNIVRSNYDLGSSYFNISGLSPDRYYWHVKSKDFLDNKSDWSSSRYFDVIEPNTPPTLNITQPSSNITVGQGEIITISWNGTDPDDSAVVSIGYDQDNIYNNGNHTWIALNQPEDGSYAWDTSGVALGEYSVFGFIYDGEEENHDYASGKVTIISALPIINWFEINSNDPITSNRTVVLNNSCTNNPTHYIASENATFSDATWENYSSSPSFELSSGNGTKRVYFKVKNGFGECELYAYDDIELLDQTYSISGRVLSRRWPNDGVPGATVETDAGQSFITNNQGEYTIENVPSGNRFITAYRDDYWATGTFDSVSRSENLIGNLANIDFVDFACKGTAEVSVSVDDESVNPGDTFNVTVTLKNINYALSNGLFYLDLSFSDDKVIVGTPSGNGWTSITSYPVGSTIWYVNSSGDWSQITSTEYLISGERSGNFANNGTYSLSVPITVKQEATSGAITLKYRGTIGDERDPDSSGSGDLDQQGLNVKTLEVTVESVSPEIPSSWILSETNGSYYLFGNSYFLKIYSEGSNVYPVVFKDDGTNQFIVTDPIVLKTVVNRFSMLSGNGQWEYYLNNISDQINKWAELENQWRQFNIVINPQDYTDLCKKSRLSKSIIWGAVIVAGVGAALSAPLTGGTSIFVGGAIISGLLSASAGALMYAQTQIDFYNDIKLEDEYYLIERAHYFTAKRFLEFEHSDQTEALVYSNLITAYQSNGINAEDIAQALTAIGTISSGISGAANNIKYLETTLPDISNIAASVIAEGSSRLIDWRMSQYKNDYLFTLALNDHHTILESLSKETKQAYILLNSSTDFSCEEVQKAYDRLPFLIAFYRLCYMELASNKRFEKLSSEAIKEELSFLVNQYDVTPFSIEKQQAESIGVSEQDSIQAYHNYRNDLITSLVNAYDVMIDVNKIVGNFISIENNQSIFDDVYLGGQSDYSVILKNLSNYPININDINITPTSGINVINFSPPTNIEPNSIENLGFTLDLMNTDESQLTSENNLVISISYSVNGEYFQDSFKLKLRVMPSIFIKATTNGESLCHKGESKSFKIETDAKFSGAVVFKTVDFYGNEYTVSNFSVPTGFSTRDIIWDIPALIKNGPYTAKFEINSVNKEYIWKYQRVFSILPDLTGDFGGFDFSNCSIITSDEDEEIARRISLVFENSLIYYTDGLTAGELLPLMQNDNLILIGGHEANLLVEDLIFRGLIADDQWIAPGDASVEIIENPFYPIAPQGYKAIVVAGYTVEDTFLAGLKLISEKNKLPVLNNIVIIGPDSINESTLSNQYNAIAYFSDGTNTAVTADCNWIEDSLYADISSIGELTAYSVSEDQTVIITATYTFNNVTKEDTHNVLIQNIVEKILDRIEIEGLIGVDEDSSQDYNCRAYYTDGTNSLVQPQWAEDSIYADISTTGLLTTYEVNSSQICQITASYTEGVITKDDTHDISILNIQTDNPNISGLSPSSGPIATQVTISGSDFGETEGTVTFSGINAPISSWTDTLIETEVPSGASTGPVVAHTSDGKDSNEVIFTVSDSDNPEIIISQDSSEIPSGGSFNFGSIEVRLYQDVTFTIENTGTADLTLSDVVISGVSDDQFSVEQQPASPVSAGADTNFIIRFSPTSEGLKTATISIPNNDSDGRKHWDNL